MEFKKKLLCLLPILVIIILLLLMILNRCDVTGFGVSNNKEIADGIGSSGDNLIVYIYDDNNNLKSTINKRIRGGFVLKCENDQICIYLDVRPEKLIYDFNGNFLKEEQIPYTNPTAKFNKKQEINIDDIIIKYNKNFFGYESIIKVEKGISINVLHNSINIYFQKLFFALFGLVIFLACIFNFYKNFIVSAHESK